MTLDSITDYLKQSDEDCKNLIGKSEQDIREFLVPLQNRLDNNTTGNIYATFGEFLYNALGAKVNPQPKNKMLDVWYKDNAFTKKDADGNETVITDNAEILKILAKQNERSNWYNSGNSKSYKITHATCGKMFGMGYVTPGGSVCAVTIPQEYIFFYLTQEHVDIITNKQKRACAQEFLQFRDAFMKIRDELNSNEIHQDVKIPIDVGVFKEVAVDNAVRSNYNSSTSRFLIHECTSKGEINLLEIRMRNVGTHGGKDTIKQLIQTTSRSLKETFELSNDADKSHAIHIMAFKMNKKREMTYYGSIQLKEKGTLTPLDIDEIKQTHSVCYFTRDMSNQYYAKSYSPATKLALRVSQSNGLVLNWNEVFANEQLASLIDQRVKFFENASKTLHYLKKKHAKLVFIHGIF